MLTDQEWRSFSKGEDPEHVSEDRHLFDSRIEVDLLGPAPHKFWTDEAQRKEYYTTKFRYFSEVLKVKMEDPSKAPSFGPNGVPADVLATWEREFPAQAKAYVLRYLQLPTERVHLTWYNGTQAFGSWAQGLLLALAAEPHGLLATWLNFPVCLSEEFEIHDWVEAGVQQVSTLPGEATLTLSVSLSRQPRPAAAIARAFQALEAVLAEGRGGYADAVAKILDAMQAEFGVEICDYLQVSDLLAPSEPSLLDFQATTSGHSVDDLKAGEPAYDFAEGITGSAFLTESDAVGRVLLTNVLELDPRQSKKHADTYVNAYGPIHNFCIVPVFDGSQFVGVFRFINRQLDAQEPCCTGHRGTWPLDYRIELTSLAAWLSGPMRALRLTLESVPDSALSEVVRNPKWMAWAPLRVKSALLRDLAQVATMRDEHRSVSAAVLAASPARCYEFEAQNNVYNEMDAGYLTQATKLFGRLLPGAGVFVTDVSAIPPDGRIRYRSVVNTGQLSFADAVQHSTRVTECSLLYAHGSVSVVQCYERQQWSADYFLNEKLGRWQMRSRATLEEVLESWPARCEMTPRTFMDLVFKRVIPYSYTGHGGLVVISHTNPRDNAVRFGFHVDQSFEMDAALFERVLAVDGGTWIRPDGIVELGGIIFKTENSDGEGLGGARHQAAEGLVAEDSTRVVIAISANRPITFFSAGDELRI